MRMVDLIQKKRDGLELTDEEIDRLTSIGETISLLI